jgi:phospholipase C
MPVMMKAVAGKTDVYQLKNMWADETYQHWLTLTATKNGSRVFMESSATEANAFEFHVESAGKPGTYYFLTPDTRHYIGFCTSDCADGYWVTGDASTTSDAMAVQLVPVPAPTPPPTYPPTPPKPPTPAPPAPAPLPPNLEIEHVVMLMMENRPYDFFYGWADLPGANGLNRSGTPECNYFDPNNTAKGKSCVAEGKAYYVCQQGPLGSFDIWTNDIWGPGVWNGVSALFVDAVRLVCRCCALSVH